MRALLITAALLAGAVSPAMAKVITVQMKNKGSQPGQYMVFEPAFVKASVGDTIKFMPTNPGHIVQSIDGMMPAGTPKIAGQINKEVDLTVTKPGIYAVKCQPHYSMGMVAVVDVGPAPNLAAAKAAGAKLPGLAAKRMMPLLAQAN